MSTTTTNYDMSATENVNIPSSEMSTLSSIYIPRVYANLSTEFVAETFEFLDLGVVDRVETVPRPGDKTTYMAFVYFASWNTENKAAANLAKRINTPGGPQARIVYDDPWFWILLPNKSEKTSSSKKMNEDEFLEEFNRSNTGICAQEWDQQQERKKEEEKLKKEFEDLVEIDEALRAQELDVDEKVDILYDMVEDLQVRLLESEKNNKEKIKSLEKELYNLRTIMLTGEPANDGDYEYWTHRQADTDAKESGVHVSANVFDDLDYIPSPPKLLRQTARAYNFDDMPSSPPKLIRQNACVRDTERGMMTPPPPPGRLIERQTTGWWPTRINQMGLVYSETDDDDKNFWCDP